jgi:hypothetical protein
MKEPYSLDRSHFSVVGLHDDTDERTYWWSKTPEERLAALEYLRQITYEFVCGYADDMGIWVAINPDKASRLVSALHR